METNITARELFASLTGLIRHGAIAARPRQMHELLVLTCTAGLRDETRTFGNLFSQVDYLCRKHHVAYGDMRAIQQMRVRSNQRRGQAGEKDFLEDCRALALLISAVFSEDIPSELVRLIPPRFSDKPQLPPLSHRCLRCVVEKIDGQRLILKPDNAEENLVEVLCEGEQLERLPRMLRQGMMLNLINCRREQPGDKRLMPQFAVVEPDLLLDISSLAACFEDFGHSPLYYILRLMQPRQTSQAILLGNFAGRALDDIINCNHSWEDTLRTHFAEQAMDFCGCEDFSGKLFKQDAEKQWENIRGIVDDLFESGEKTFDRDRATLEPSFVCEELGLQGRVDLMTTDFRLLVEQKSGKNFFLERRQNNEHGSVYIEKHFVQMLLYYAMLRRNFNLSKDHIDGQLLYSKYPYPAGLVSVAPYQKLFLEAMQLRNGIVALIHTIADTGLSPRLLRHFTPDELNRNHSDSRLWTQYQRPQLETMLRPLHQMSPLTQLYFTRFSRFVCRELLASRTESHEAAGSSVADMWNMPLEEKRESGNIYTDLHIINKVKSQGGHGFDTLELSVGDQGANFLPNFRTGDAIYLYAYKAGTVPDARHALLLRGTLTDIRQDRLTVHLNNAQQNEHVFTDFDFLAPGEQPAYAIEHSDRGFGNGLRALYEFISADDDRRALLLGEREPRRDTSVKLSRSYHANYDEVILQAMQAQDYYLLLGPPGTGKTSMALQFLVRETLTRKPGCSLLLMAYTNRAVDEICNMLSDNHIDFLRIGNEFLCAEPFRDHMAQNALRGMKHLNDIRQRIAGTQVIVGTTTSIQSQASLLGMKHFELAVVDEASQILEPDLIGLLASHRSGGSDISRFILIGDHKQLPAVVQQGEEASKVAERELTEKCITDCRQSLFERLLRWERHEGRTCFTGTLHHQGRMHPAVAAFPSGAFYRREQLDCVPLPHQREEGPVYRIEEKDELDRRLCHQRVLFIPSEDTQEASDKVNSSEARIVADLLLRLQKYYGKDFDPQRTVGVIVPYRNQIAMIRREAELRGVRDVEQLSIDTVERYQGSQRDVIIYSFTVQHRYQLDFLCANTFREDGEEIDRKLNVAMTRARRQLILTGNVPTLSHNPLFRRLIGFIRKDKT